MQVKVIVNPSSGRERIQENIHTVVERLSGEGLFRTTDIFYTKEANDGYREVAQLQPDEYDLLIAVGGDGTIHEVVNGILDSGSQVPLAIMPAGTVNDFGKYVGVPDDVNSFCEMIRAFKTQDVDVGKVGNEYFLNVFAGGLFTDISYKVPREMKMVLGELAYYIAGVINTPANISKSYTLEIAYDGQVIEEQALIFIISNTPSVGGFKKICPQAAINDGLLDVCIIRKTGLEGLVPLFFQLLRGEHIDSPLVSYFQTQYMEIRHLHAEEGEIYMDMDGEQKGSLPATVEAIPGALRILVP